MLSIFLVQSEIIVVGCVIVDYWEDTGIYCLTFFFSYFFLILFFTVLWDLNYDFIVELLLIDRFHTCQNFTSWFDSCFEWQLA